MAMHPYHLALRIKTRLPLARAYHEANPLRFRGTGVLTVVVGAGVGLLGRLMFPTPHILTLAMAAAGAGIAYGLVALRRARLRQRRKDLLERACREIRQVEQEHPQVLRTLASYLGNRVSYDPQLAGELSRYHELLREPDRYWALLEALMQRLESAETGAAPATA